MYDADTLSPATPGEPARRRRAARAAGLLGELLLTASIIVALYVAYTLWGTGIATQRAQDELLNQTIGTWGQDAGADANNSGATGHLPPEPSPELGDAVAVLRIPRLGADWQWAVVEGVTTEQLARGPGHYPETALPGQIGNFAVAGHRSGHGEPFAQFDQVRPGDEVVVETATAIYTYLVDRSQIVQPDDVWVIEPVPGEPDIETTESLLTLTTCHPRWGSEQRLIIFGHLASVAARSGGG